MKMKKNLLFVLLSMIGIWTGSQRAFALDQKDGIYQIATAQDLVEFSAVVAAGEQSANAVVTADLDIN